MSTDTQDHTLIGHILNYFGLPKLDHIHTHTHTPLLTQKFFLVLQAEFMEDIPEEFDGGMVAVIVSLVLCVLVHIK